MRGCGYTCRTGSATRLRRLEFRGLTRHDSVESDSDERADRITPWGLLEEVKNTKIFAVEEAGAAKLRGYSSVATWEMVRVNEPCKRTVGVLSVSQACIDNVHRSLWGNPFLLSIRRGREAVTITCRVSRRVYRRVYCAALPLLSTTRQP
jgi:hypothetical protein